MKPTPSQYQAAASFAENTRFHETRSEMVIQVNTREMVPSMAPLPSEYNAVPNITSKKVFKPGRMLKRQQKKKIFQQIGSHSEHVF